MLANKERMLAQKELDDFRTKFKEQQIREEIRHGELYRALVKNNHPPVIYSSTTFKPTYGEEIPGYEGFWRKLQEQDIDPDNVKVKSNSHLLSIAKNGRVMDPDSDANYGYSSAKESLNYLKYFDETNNGMGVRVGDRTGKYNLPDDPENLLSLSIGEDEMATDAVRLLRKNKDRLVLLEEMENTEVERLDKMLRGRNEFKEEVKRPTNGFVSDEGIQELKSNFGENYADSLLDQMNYPRAFIST